MAKPTSLIPLLAQTDLFKGLESKYLNACAAAFRQIPFAKGEMLFARGEALARERGLILADTKYEFGLDPDGRIILADEISSDSCRLWDTVTNEKLDKDRFRRDLGNVIESYTEVARRLGIMKEMPTVIQGGIH